jgi:hypothetical protein
LRKLIIAKGADYLSSTGLSIYFPSSLELLDPQYLAEYQDFFAATGWDALLNLALKGT